MRSNPTFVETQRRTQLVDAAIAVIARKGYANTSLAAVAEEAGTSKGVLLYHFAGKDDLVAALISEVFRVAREVVGPRVRDADGPREQLLAYITERIRVLGTHRPHMQALLDIAISCRDADGRHTHQIGPELAVRDIDALLAAGQRDGSLRDFQRRPMALSISQAIDGVLLQLATDPDLDLELWAREVTTTFDLATRREA